MRRSIAFLAVSTLTLAPFTSIFAQQDSTSSGTNANSGNTTSVSTTTTSSTTTLNAAPNTSAVNTTSTNLGEYKEVACSTDAAYAANSCNQCFVGKSVKVGQRLTDLFDNWTNTTPNILVAYKNEQKTPNLVSFDSKWTPSSADETKMWKSSSDVVWTPGTDSKGDSYMLTAGQKIRFIQSDLGAGYTLDSTNKKNGDMVALIRFPVVYRTMDATSGVSSADSTTHYECVSYNLDAPVTTVTPTPDKQKTTTPPPAATKTETGPAETLVLIIAAFFIAFGLMISLRKRA